MSLETLLIVGLMVLLALGAAATAVVIRRAAAPPSSARFEANPMAARVVGEVHAGEEQTLIHLARVLALPAGKEGAGYGEIYLAGSAGTTMRLATRSEIGRGFDAEIRVHRTRRSSIAEYYVLRVPGDETVLRRIEGLDDRIVAALRTLDPEARVRRIDGGSGDSPRGRPA